MHVNNRARHPKRITQPFDGDLQHAVGDDGRPDGGQQPVGQCFAVGRALSLFLQPDVVNRQAEIRRDYADELFLLI